MLRQAGQERHRCRRLIESHKGLRFGKLQTVAVEGCRRERLGLLECDKRGLRFIAVETCARPIHAHNAAVMSVASTELSKSAKWVCDNDSLHAGASSVGQFAPFGRM